MKILFLTPYVPLPPNFGGAMRVYYLLKGLSQNHEVTFLTFGNKDKVDLLNKNVGLLYKDYYLVKPTWAWKYRRLAQLFALLTSKSFFSLFTKSKEMQAKINEILSLQDFDIIQMEFPIMGCFHFRSRAMKILDEHNIEYDNFYRMWKKTKSPLIKLHYKREFTKSRMEEINVCKKMDAILTVSGKDKSILQKEIPGIPKFIIPNGVDVEYFKPSPQKIEPYSMVFTGMMAYMPNHDGMNYFLDEIFPLILKQIPEAKIYIVGNRPPKNLKKRSSKNIIITGFVPDVRSYVWHACLYVVPLRMGGGTRLKVLEALAMKKTVVSTTIGSEGIEVINNESVLIADEAEDFANKSVRILKNPESGENLAARGFDLVCSKYSWEVVTQKLEEAHQNILYEKTGTLNTNMLIERTG